MRLPKRVDICGKMYAVIPDPDSDGGTVDTDKRVITIGTSDTKEVAENLIHEVGEAIMMARDFRYAAEREVPENEHYRFVLDHKEWQLFCKDFSIALRGVKFDK